MKKYVAAVLICLLLICLTSAVAAGGTASDPLVSQSYVDGTLVPELVDSGTEQVTQALTALYDQSLAQLEGKVDYWKVLAGGTDDFSYGERYQPLYTSVDSTVQLLTGSTIIPTAGAASAVIASGTLINISTGTEVSSGSTLANGQRYFCAEDTFVTVTSTAGGSFLVDGYYKASPEVGTVMAPPPGEIYATMQRVTFNDQVIQLESYNVDGYNYFKLRDIAYLMMGTGSQFSISTEGAKALVYAETGGTYTPVGGEMETGEDRSDSCVPSSWRLLVDDQYAPAHAYNFGGNNFFKLRDLGESLNFDVDYDYNTGTVLIYSR